MRDPSAAAALLVPALLAIGPAAAQPPVLPLRSVDAPIREVVLFAGGGNASAAVTRAATVELPQGRSRLRLEGLPPQLDRDSVQARIAGSARLLELELRRVPDADPQAGERAANLDRRIDELTRAIGGEEEPLAIAEAEWAFLDRLGEKAADGAAADGTLDPAAVEASLRFLAERRGAILRLRREAGERLEALRRELEARRRERAALGPAVRQRLVADLVVEAEDAGPAELQLTYRVRGPRWSPAYRLRTDGRGGAIAIEYDALVAQATGEDWNEVQLELSTADASPPTVPPRIRPIWIDLRPPPPPPGRVASAAAMDATLSARASGFGGGGADAAIIESATAVSYRLPLAVTVPSSGDETRRLRIGAIEATPTLAFLARPVTGAPPVLRAKVANPSGMILLPGPASLFVDGDFVGEVDLPEVAGRGEFEVFLGNDPRVEATRRPVIRQTSSTGLFGGGRLTTLDHRIELENRLPREATVELWDRRPISRSDRIEVTLANLSRPLDNDAAYLADGAPTGLLKWTIVLGPAGTPESKASIAWQVRISHASDTETTPIPE